MAKESLYSPQKAPIFRETFADEQTTRTLGGVPNSVTYSNGVATFTSSLILYTKNYRGTYSLRIKFTAITPTNNKYLLDFRTNSGVGYLYFNSGTSIESSSGTNYVDGVASSTVSSATKEIIVSGISLTATFVNLMYNYLLAGNAAGSVELLEIYDYTLTANEVANISSNKRYEALQYASGVSEILNINVQNGIVADKWGNAFTNTVVTPVQTGNIKSMNFNGSTSRLSFTGFNNLTGDKTFIVWINTTRYGVTNPRIIDNTKVLFYVANTGTLRFQSDGSTDVGGATGAIKLGSWVMGVVTRTSAGVTNFYVNGALSGTANQSSGTPVSSTTMAIGSTTVSSEYYTGYLSGLRIINGILDAQTVSQLYSNERRNYNI